MLYRLLGLLGVAVLCSIGLSWYLEVPVLALLLRLLLTIKSIKWIALWQGLRTYLLTRAPIQLLWDLPYRLLTPLARGIGFIDVYYRIYNRCVALISSTLASYRTLPLWLRILLEVALTVGLIWLMAWNSWFLVLVIFVPSEVTRGFSLLITSYLSRKLANTAFLRVYNTSLAWFMQTPPGRVLHWLNARYEALIGQRMEQAGAKKRQKLAETDAGKKFLAWLDRNFPPPPLLLKPQWRVDPKN